MAASTKEWKANAADGSGSFNYQCYRMIDHETAVCEYQASWWEEGTSQSHSEYVDESGLADVWDPVLEVSRNSLSHNGYPVLNLTSCSATSWG